LNADLGALRWGAPFFERQTMLAVALDGKSPVV
jgi:hypothetical protein